VGAGSAGGFSLASGEDAASHTEGHVPFLLEGLSGMIGWVDSRLPVLWMRVFNFFVSGRRVCWVDRQGVLIVFSALPDSAEERGGAWIPPGTSLLERCIGSICWFSEYADAMIPGIGFLL
jgi:hypothetical protein